MTNRTKRWWWAVAIFAVALLALKTFVPFGVYHVPSASMEPTIQGGERVLVRYDRSAPARFDPVVALRKGEDTPFVKRAAGLPGERVQIVEGDLLINGKRLGPEEPRPRPIPVFDERWMDPESGFRVTDANRAFWKREEGEWTLVARTGTGARAESRLEFYGDVKDSYLDAAHAFVAGEVPVNDLALELELSQEEPGTRAEFALSEAGDVFELVLDLAADGRLSAAFVRRGEDAAGAPETLAMCRLERGAKGWHRVRFSNIDNSLCFERDGARVLQWSYEENRFARNDTRQEGRNLLPRAAIGGGDGTLRFRGLCLARDLYYTQRGEFATQGSKDLGPDGYFLLGDNSSNSRDGREWGETHAEELIGRPVEVVWPLAHGRAIEGAIPPPPPVR